MRGAALVLGGTTALVAAALLLATALRAQPEEGTGPPGPPRTPARGFGAPRDAGGAPVRPPPSPPGAVPALVKERRRFGYLLRAPFPPRPIAPPPPPFALWGAIQRGGPGRRAGEGPRTRRRRGPTDPTENVTGRGGRSGEGGAASRRGAPARKRRTSIDHAHLRKEGLVVMHAAVDAKRRIDEAAGRQQGDPGWGDRWRSCAVVGNTWRNGARGWGDDIDSHEAVVRLNGAELGQGTGRRTTVDFLSGTALQRCGEQPRCPCYRGTKYQSGTIAVLTSTYGAHQLASLRRCQRAHPHGVFHDLGPALHHLANRTAAAYLGAAPAAARPQGAAVEVRPLEKDVVHSTGLQAVLLAVALCQRVSLYGFGGSDPDPVDVEHRPEGRAGDPAGELGFYRHLAEGTSHLGEWLHLPPLRVVD